MWGSRGGVSWLVVAASLGVDGVENARSGCHQELSRITVGKI